LREGQEEQRLQPYAHGELLEILLLAGCLLGASSGPKGAPDRNTPRFEKASSGKNILFIFFSHSCTVHLEVIKVFYLPTDAQKSCFKRILKFTLKQLLHVSVQSPSSGGVLFELAEVTVIKIIS
jgi:hypothetical protein